MKPNICTPSLAAALLALGFSLNLLSAQERREEPRPRPDAPREPQGPRREQGRPEQPPGERRDPPRDGGRQPEGQRFQPPQPIELSEAQREAVRDAWDSVREDMRDLGQKMMTARRELNEVVFAEKADADAIRKAASKLGEAEAEMAIIRQRVFAKVRRTLKPDQIESLKQSPFGFGMLMTGSGPSGAEGRPSAQPPREGQVRPPVGEARPPREGEARPREGDARPPVRRPEANREGEPRKPQVERERPADEREAKPEIRRPEAGDRPREPRREGGEARATVQSQTVAVSTVNGRTVVNINGKQVFEGETTGRVSAKSINFEGKQFTAVWDDERVIWENVKGAAEQIRGDAPRRSDRERVPEPKRGAPERRPEGGR